MPQFAFHEDYSRLQQAPSSSRAFGLVMALASAAGAFWPLRVGSDVRWPLAVAALVFALAAAVHPRLLEPLNAAWTRLALLLAHLSNPVIMAILFYGLIVPAGFLARWAGWLSLRRKPEPGRASYWLPRIPPGPSPDSFERQF